MLLLQETACEVRVRGVFVPRRASNGHQSMKTTMVLLRSLPWTMIYFLCAYGLLFLPPPPSYFLFSLELVLQRSQVEKIQVLVTDLGSLFQFSPLR